MEINIFIEKFSDLVEETDKSILEAKTRFRDLEEWGSLIALSVIAMVDEEYSVKLKGDDMRNSQTIQDLFDIVKSRI
ncbi:MAG: acyl carrier protein [Prevotella sp.]|jgi:acyl carrier protein|nr:acyl carrier protein [Prevotella sp.]